MNKKPQKKKDKYGNLLQPSKHLTIKDKEIQKKYSHHIKLRTITILSTTQFENEEFISIIASSLEGKGKRLAIESTIVNNRVVSIIVVRWDKCLLKSGFENIIAFNDIEDAVLEYNKH